MNWLARLLGRSPQPPPAPQEPVDHPDLNAYLEEREALESRLRRVEQRRQNLARAGTVEVRGDLIQRDRRRHP